MQPKVLTLGKSSIVFGTDWHDASGGKPTAEVKRLGAEKSARSYVLVAAGPENVVCGLAPLALDDSLPKNSKSFAALLAGYPGIALDALFIQEVEGGAVLVALRNGLPVAGFDGFGTLEEIALVHRRFSNMVPGGITVYGNTSAFSAIPLTLEDVLEQSAAGKSSTFAAIPTNAPWILLGLVVVGAALAGGWTYYDAYRKAEELRMAQQPQTVDPNIAYDESVALALSTRVNAFPALKAAAELAASTPTSINGWVLDKVMCSPGACLFSWMRDTGTNDTFVAPEGAQAVTLSLEGGALSYTLTFPVEQGMDKATFGRAEDMLIHTVSRVQLNSEHDVRLTATPPTLLGTATVAAEMLRAPVHEGSYLMQGPWWALSVIESLPRGASFESLEVQMGTPPYFKINGRYHVNTK